MRRVHRQEAQLHLVLAASVSPLRKNVHLQSHNSIPHRWRTISCNLLVNICKIINSARSQLSRQYIRENLSDNSSKLPCFFFNPLNSRLSKTEGVLKSLQVNRSSKHWTKVESNLQQLACLEMPSYRTSFTYQLIATVE